MAIRSFLLRAHKSWQCLMKEIDQGFSPGMKDLTITAQKHRHYSSSPVTITPIAEAKRFMKDCFEAIGTQSDHAEIVATNLIEADYQGHYSHGMNRLEKYLRDIQQGTTKANAKTEVVKESVATAVMDGKNGIGAVIGKRCMEIAICKAKEAGIGLVVARGSNHFGLAAIYGSQAIKEGLLGLTFSNTSPYMTPTRAKKCALGTNPLSLGAPGLKGDYFLLDMATTAVAVGKIELAKRKNMKIPPGWAVNDQGVPETDPAIAFKAAKLMPLGGTEEHSGHKGYGLGMMVEIFCGILSGSAFGPYVRPWGKSKELANLGQAFMAIDPCAFEPGFAERLSKLLCHLRQMEPVNPEKPVAVHGDYERSHMAQVDQDGGLKYVENQHKTNNALAKELNVKPMISCDSK